MSVCFFVLQFWAFFCYMLYVVAFLQRQRQKTDLRIEGEVTTTNKEHVADLLAVAKKAGWRVPSHRFNTRPKGWFTWKKSPLEKRNNI